MTATHEIESLLQDDGWLRRIAGSLLGDGHDVDDALQDAYLAALEGRGRAKNLRRWLAGVVRFKALGSRRARRRAVGWLETTPNAPATDDVVAMDEIRAQIAAMVLELAEPQRSAIHLAFIAGLPMKRVAEELSVAPSTATHHVSRGLMELRRRLDAQSGGDRSMWASALVAGFGTSRSASAPSRASAGMGFAAAWVAAMAVAWFGLTAQTGPVPTAMDESLGSPRGAHLAGATHRVALSDEAAPPAIAPARPRGRTSTPGSVVRATFLLPDGSPAAGCPWTISEARTGWNLTQREFDHGIPGPFSSLSGVLDEDGRLQSEVEGHLARLLSVSAASTDHGELSRIFTAPPGEATQLGTWRFEKRPSVRGRLLDGANQPVTGYPFRAELRSAAGLSDRGRIWAFGDVDPDTGTFRVFAPRQGEYQLVVESLDHRHRVSTEVSLTSDSAHDVTLEIDPADLHVAGLRLAPDRRSPALRHVQIIPHGVTALDAAGRELPVRARGTSLDIVEPDSGPMTIRIEDPRLEPIRVQDLHLGEIRRITYRGSAAVRLMITDHSGTPVDRFAVSLGGDVWEERAQLLHDGRSALAQGMISGFLPGSYELLIRAPQGVARVPLEDLGASEVRDVPIQLEPVTRIQGVALWDDGSPMAGVHVGIARDDSHGANPSRPFFLKGLGFTGSVAGPPTRQETARAVVDADGSFELTALGAGRHTLFHHSTPTSDGTQQPQWDAEVMLSPGTSQTVKISAPRPALLNVSVRLPGESGRRVQRLAFRPVVPEGGLIHHPIAKTLDAIGEIHDLLLPPGTYDVELGQGPGWSSHGTQPLGRLTVRPGEARRIELDARSNMWCELTISVSAAEDLGPGVDVQVSPIGEAFPMGSGTVRRALRSDGRAGPFHMPLGPVAIELFSPQWSDTTQPELSLTLPGPALEEIEVSTVTKRIQVLAVSGPLAHVEVKPAGRGAALIMDQPALQESRTDAEGWVTLRLAPGELVLHAPDLDLDPVTVHWPQVDQVLLR